MADDFDDDREYFDRLANYSRGCPGIGREDVCEDPAACAADGGCKELRDQRANREPSLDASSLAILGFCNWLLKSPTRPIEG